MTPRKLAGTLSLAAILVLSASSTFAGDQTLVKAKGLLDTGNPQAAYDLLAPMQSDRAGDPEYDFLLGSAALDLGKNTEAVFALERVLALEPNNGPARAQIARAYFNLKETETARREFENVKRQDIPPEVRATIDRYLDAITRIGETEQASARFFLEFAIGWDSNVNSATAIQQVAVPAFGGLIFTLAAPSRSQSDGLFAAAGGMSFRSPISKSWAMVGGLSFYQRFNFVEDNFDTGFLDGYAGVSTRFGRETLTAVAQGNMFTVADPVYAGAYRNALGGTLQWTHDFSARSQFTAYLQYASLEYPDQTPRNANRYIAGVGYAHAFRGGDPILYAGAYGGVEKTKDSSFDYLGHQPIGLRLGGQKALAQKWLMFFSAAYERRKYSDVDPYFLVTRKDNQYSAGLGLSYLLPQEWRLSPQVTYLYNNSNIHINEYHRLQAFVSLRRDW